MSVLDLKLRRELKAARWLFLAITSMIVVGVLCFVEMRSLYNNLRHAQQDYYTQCRMADFWIDLKKAPLAELARLNKLPGIIQTRARIQFHATIDLPGVAKPLSGLTLSLPDQRAAVINDVVIRHGGYFTDRREDEVIVGDAFARAHRIGPGDQIHLLMGNRRQRLTVVGTAISSEYVYLVGPGSITPDPKNFGVFYLKRTFAERIFEMDGAANQVVGLLTPRARQRPDELLAQAKRLLKPFGVVGTTARKDQVSHLFLMSEINGLGVFATILPSIFLAVAALVLNVLMSRMADQQRTVIGTLKAIGIHDQKIFFHYLKFGLMVGTLGGVVGCGLGYWMAEAMTSLYHQFFEFPKLENRAYPLVYGAGLAISIASSMLGSLRGARSALRLQPAAAMRPRPPVQGRTIWLERLGPIWRSLTFPTRMILRNVIRNRVRASVGLFAAAMGTSLLVVGFMSMEAMEFLVNFQFEKILRSDLDLVFQTERGEDAWLEAQRLPGVDAAEPVLHVPGTLSNGPYRRPGTITGLLGNARLTVPRDVHGRPLPIPEAGLLMTRKAAQLLHASVGDVLTVTPTKGMQRLVAMPVVEIADSYLGTSVYADIVYLSRQVGEQLALTGVQLEVDTNPSMRKSLYRALKQMPTLQSVSARSDMIDNINQALLETQNISIAILVLFAGVIFFGSILNSSLVNMTERLREIATLRVLGYSPWQIGGLILRESMLVNLLGTLLGLPLGYLLYSLMAQWYDFELVQLPIVAPAWIWIVTLLLAILFGLAAHLVVQWRIHHLDWLEALKVHE